MLKWTELTYIKDKQTRKEWTGFKKNSVDVDWSESMRWVGEIGEIVNQGQP